MDGRGIKDLHKCGEEMSKNSSLPSQEQQETSELNGSGGGRGKGIRGPRSFVPVRDTNQDKRGPFIPVDGSNRDKRLRGPFVPVGATNRDKRPPFCPGWCLQPGQKAPVPPPSPLPLARLVVGPETKATYCSGPKGCRDKWPGTKVCFIVVKSFKVLIKIVNSKIFLLF